MIDTEHAQNVFMYQVVCNH